MLTFSNAEAIYRDSCWAWHTPLILALERKRYAELFKFEGSLLYKVSARKARIP